MALAKGGSLMPAAMPCTVCEHADRVAVEAALRSGSPSLRTTADRYKLSKTAILRHRDKHMTGPVRTNTDVVRDRVRDAAPAQLARATEELVKVRAERLVENALEAQQVAQRLAERAVDGELDVAEAARVVKIWVDANGGGVAKALHLLGMATGEIATGSQVNVQVQVAVADVTRKVGEANGRWLAEDVPAALQAGLEECGFSDDGNLAKVKAILMRHLAGARGALKERMAGELPAGGGT